MPSKSSNRSKATDDGKKTNIITKFDGKVYIDHCKNWEAVMDHLCHELKIPSITNRKNLKKMHTKIDDMYSRLEDMYRNSPPSKIDYVRGGIVMIFCQMFMDSVLRDKLFEKGVLDLIIPLFDSDRTRQVAALTLKALCTHGSFKVRRAVAEKANHIARSIRNSLDDYKLAYFGISTITLCLKSILEEHTRSGTKPDVAVFQMFRGFVDILPILKAVVESVKRHHAEPTGDILYHGVDLLSTIGMFSPDAFKAYPPAVRFLVAGLRSKDWVTRGKCLHGLIGVYCRDARHQPDTIDPRILQEVFKNGIPDKFTEIYDLYEPECDRELVTAAQCASQYFNAISKFPRTQNLCALGKKQVELILQSEYSVIEGQIGWLNRDDSVFDPFDSDEIPADHPNRWLFEKFTDSLPLCARALRERNFRGDREKADILDIKYLLFNGGNDSDDEVLRLAERALRRSPNQAFFHYAVSQTADHNRGLLAAKKGLECPNLTPSLKWLLLERLVHHAALGGAGFFMRNPPPTKAQSKGAIASLEYAYANAKQFIMKGPPDSRLMKPVGYWLVLLTMVMEENISRDLKEFEDPFEMIGVSTKFWEMIDVPAKESQLYLAQDAALKHYDAAQAEFSYVFEAPYQTSEAAAFPIPTDDESHDGIVAWFEGMNLEDQAADSIEQSTGPLVKKKQERPGVQFNVVMYPCSWCHNPSAAVKKCAGCTKVLYCGKDCQRSHWDSSHKAQCKS